MSPQVSLAGDTRTSHYGLVKAAPASFSSDAVTERHPFSSWTLALKKLLTTFVAIHNHPPAWALAGVFNFSPPVLLLVSQAGFSPRLDWCPTPRVAWVYVGCVVMTSHPVPTALLPRLPCRSRFRFYLMACSKPRSGHAARLCLLSHLLCSSSASTNPSSLPVHLQLPALKDGVSPLWCRV